MYTEDQNAVIEKYKADKSAKSSFRYGVASLFAWFIPIIGFPVAIAGLVKASHGKESVDFKKKADLAMTFSWIGLTLSILNAFLGILIR